MFYMSMAVSLDDGLAAYFVSCQVSKAEAISIDAHQMPAIHDLPVRLGRMTHNDTLAAYVGAW